jgi:hypothetical protein
MKQATGTLIVVASLLVACASRSDPAEIACDHSQETAVILTLLDEQGAPLGDVSLIYRYNEGDWQEWPERVNGRAVIYGAAGAYHIRAEKQGYEAAEMAVTVAPLAEGMCGVVAQASTLRLARAACPVEPQPLTVDIIAPTETAGVTVTATSPNASQPDLACSQDGAGGCRPYTLPLASFGVYTITVAGLPGEGYMKLEDGVVAYTYEPYEIRLGHGQRQQLIQGQGAATVTIQLPVEPDEISCPLANFQAVTYTPDPDRREEAQAAPDVELWQQGGLTITDLDAAVCQGQPELAPVAYEVVLPAGTRLSDVEVVYRAGEEAWQTAECHFASGQYLCTAQVPNPLVGQPFAIKALLQGQEYVGTQLPFDTVCMVFEE